jgi:hypothetical protein
MNQPLFVWAKKSWINVGVQIGHRQAKTTRVPTQEQRLAWLKELLTGTPNPFPCRVAGTLLLLYAQPLVRIAAVQTTVVVLTPLDRGRESSHNCREVRGLFGVLANKAGVPIGCPLVPNSLSDGLRRVA